jgi:branched-chain amino acid transport system permease protein
VLVAPLTQLDPSVLPLTVVPALAAALLAGFTSFGVAAAAGLAIGVLQELVFYFSTLSWFPTTGGTAIAGVSDVIVFLIIAATLYVRGVPLPPRGVLEERRLPAAPAARSVAIPAVVMTLIGFVALLALPSDFRQALVLSMIGTVVCLSLVVITGFTGQIAFSQVALGGVSGLLLAKISAHLGIGFPIAPLIAVLGATALGLLVGLSGLRVRGVNLAVVTLAAAVAIEQFWFNNSSWGGGLGSVPVPEAKLFGIDLGPRASFPTWDGKLPSPAFGLFCLVVTVALCVLVANVRRSSLGERMLAVRANERAAAAQTLNVRHVKIAAFGISSFIAGCAGVLYAYNFESVSTGNFGIVAALPFVAFAYIGGISTVTGAVISGLLVSEGLLPHAVEKWLGIPPTYELYLAGLLLIFNLTQSPEGIAGVVVPAARKRWRWLRSHTARPVVGDDPDVIEQVHP